MNVVNDTDKTPKRTSGLRGGTSRRSLLLTGGTLGFATPGLRLRSLGSPGRSDEQQSAEECQSTDQNDTNANPWNQIAKLLASDGQPGDQFGVSIAIDGNTALIGANLNDDNGFNSGSVYVFRRQGNQWIQDVKLLANDGQAGDGFGFPVALSGNTALIGAPLDDDNGFNSGSAYVFTRNGS